MAELVHPGGRGRSWQPLAQWVVAGAMAGEPGIISAARAAGSCAALCSGLVGRSHSPARGPRPAQLCSLSAEATPLPA